MPVPKEEMAEYVRQRLDPFLKSISEAEKASRRERRIIAEEKEKQRYASLSLVERLREECTLELDHPDLLEEAAAEIERLLRGVTNG